MPTEKSGAAGWSIRGQPACREILPLAGNQWERVEALPFFAANHFVWTDPCKDVAEAIEHNERDFVHRSEPASVKLA